MWLGDCQNTYLNLLKVISCLNLVGNVLKSLTEKSLTEEEVEEGGGKEKKRRKGKKSGERREKEEKRRGKTFILTRG